MSVSVLVRHAGECGDTPERRHRWHHDPIVTPPRDLLALMERVQLGDEAAFAMLYDELAASVFGVIKRVLRDSAMSEEVAQEVFVELWRTATRFDASQANVQTWALTIARRRAVDRVRTEQSQRNRTAALAMEPADTVPETDATVVASLELSRLLKAMASLPLDQRTVIELAFLHGHSHGAIADRLGLPLGTVKGRVRGGLQRLRGTLGEAS